MFFAEEKNTKILARFLREAAKNDDYDDITNKRLMLSRKIISYIYKSPKRWDKYCNYSIEKIGSRFLEILQNIDISNRIHNMDNLSNEDKQNYIHNTDNLSNEDKQKYIDNKNYINDIDSIYVMSYRFLREFDFLSSPGLEGNIELNSMIDEIHNDVDNMNNKNRSQLTWASLFLPAEIMKEFINNSNVTDFREFENKKNEAVNLKNEWDKELKDKNVEVTNLKDKLDKYKIGFNFVGLNQGFANLGKQKDKEAFWMFWSLIGMGVLILVPLITVIILTISGLFKNEVFCIEHLSALLPIISIEAILIYFFRVILFNHKSVKAQKMQIELRQTLCRFIQSYAEYSVKIKEKDNKALEKFENLIFSGIISDSEKLPSTFDGLDQISNLLKNVRNP